MQGPLDSIFQQTSGLWRVVGWCSSKLARLGTTAPSIAHAEERGGGGETAALAQSGSTGSALSPFFLPLFCSFPSGLRPQEGRPVGGAPTCAIGHRLYCSPTRRPAWCGSHGTPDYSCEGYRLRRDDRWRVQEELWPHRVLKIPAWQRPSIPTTKGRCGSRSASGPPSPGSRGIPASRGPYPREARREVQWGLRGGPKRR